MDFEGKPQSLLTFRVGPVLCCAPSLPVRSIITPPKLTHIAGSEPSTPGIFKHGSHIVKVLDLRLKFGVDEAQHTQPGNLIVTISEAGDFAFWVDQILDVFDFPKEGWGKLPPAIPRGIFTHTLLLNNKIHLYSEFEKLSTITQLGYLKEYIKQQYIQQLTQDESIKERGTNTATTSTRTANNKTVVHEPADTKAMPTETTPKKGTASSSLNKNTGNNVITPTNAGTQPFKTVSTTQKPVTTTGTTQTKHTFSQATSSPSQSTPGSHAEKPGRSSVSSNLKTASEKTTSQINASTVNPGREGIDKPDSSSTASSRATSPSSNAYHPTTWDRQPATSAIAMEDKTETFRLNKTTPTATPETEDIEENDSSYAAMVVFFLLLLLLPGAGIYYYFSQHTAKPYQHVTEIETKTQTTVTESAETPVTEPLAVQDEALKAEEQTSDSIESDTKETEVGDSLSETVSKPSGETEPLESSEYYANISQQEDEITITIHQPAPDESSQTLISPLPIKDSIEDSNEGESMAVVEAAPVKTLGDEISAPIKQEKIIKEIVHVVVKGDTLWAIAKKYVKDPFLYPELARLSNIKNPHRIYPGNRVRIRFTNN